MWETTNSTDITFAHYTAPEYQGASGMSNLKIRMLTTLLSQKMPVLPFGMSRDRSEYWTQIPMKKADPLVPTTKLSGRLGASAGCGRLLVPQCHLP